VFVVVFVVFVVDTRFESVGNEGTQCPELKSAQKEPVSEPSQEPRMKSKGPRSVNTTIVKNYFELI
jgi:hypothetical protein